MRSASVVAVLVGAGVGVIAAVSGRSRAPIEPPPLAPVAAKPLPERSEVRLATATTPVEPPAPAAPASAFDARTDDEPPVASPEEFQAAAIGCDKKDARACLRAAAAVELGTVVPKDPERAKTLRRVELTILVRSCEKGTVEACLTLADRYLRGDGLAQNERTALALVAHARELCARHPEPACKNVPTE